MALMISSAISYFSGFPGLLAAVILVFCFIYVFSRLFSGPKPGPNPFSTSHVRAPPSTLEHNRKERKKILKQRFKAELVPDNLDTIIIGSGISSLTTAVLLGRVGQKVLVLEQHDQAGGCMHTFKDKGYEFDTGIHYLGNLDEGDDGRVLVDQMTEGQVTWAKMDEEFDTIAIGEPSKAKRYSMKSGAIEEFKMHLEKQFPTEKKAIAKFVDLMTHSQDTFVGAVIPKVLSLGLIKLLIKTGLFHLIFRKFTKYTRLSLKEFLDEVSDNDTFKLFMSYAFGDLGVVPSDLSVVIYAAMMRHFISGAYYPRGGSSEIVYQIIPIIERYGGRVLVDAPVSKILIDESGKAHGLTVKRSSGDVDIFARRIVSGAGVKNTFKFMLPREVAQKNPLFSVMDRVGSSASSISVFVGLNGSSVDLGLTAGNLWAYTSDRAIESYQKLPNMTPEQVAESEIPLMFVSFPSAKDPHWEEKHPGKSVALIMTLVPRSWFTEWKDGKVKKRGQEYEDIKMKIGAQMWKQVEELFPQLDGKLDYMDVGTPLSNKHYLGQPEGEVYGLDHGRLRLRPEVSMYLRPRSGIPGLYLTGQDILTAGFNGSMKSGVLTTSAILHRNLFKDLHQLIKETGQTLKEKKRQ